MTIAEMFEQSLMVTLSGMGVVFGFLVILIIAITLTGKIIHALGWDKPEPAAAKAPAPPAPAVQENAAVAAAITAAVTAYRTRNLG
ncbi:MAG: OadG family protein [Spirochaetaceae bacterium]|jgi:oxaloacetate decarboxylase gamma subunit|nr:OadG family protein [Spirochaetaceae bacterium]